MEIHEKTCPFCGARSPLGTCCTSACETAHNAFHARAVWWKRIGVATVVVCVLSLLKHTIPQTPRMLIVTVWAVLLCVSQIVLPYSIHVVGCEKKTERRVRTTGVIALLLLGLVLVFMYTLNADTVYRILSWIAGARA